MEEFEKETAKVPVQPENPGEAAAEPVPGSDAYEWVRSCVAAVLIITIVFTFLVRMMGVQGPSMQQTLQEGDRLLVLNSPLVGSYRQGDIVIARKEAFSNDPIVKRVIAVGGQTVDIDFGSGTVYVDGVALDEDYINDRTYTDEGTSFPLTVEQGSVFIMGDNRNRSTDSREPRIGTVDERYLIGKAVFLLFPGPDALTQKRDFSRIGFLGRG